MRLAGTKLAANHQYRGFGDQLYDLSGQRPSLDLNFANSKSLVDATTGQNLVTFTRASSGTFVGSDGLVKTAAVNEPRFDHNPTTGESLGLLGEEARTNLLLQSNGFNTTWTNTNSSETSSSGTAPDGTNTAWELKDTSDASSAIHALDQSVSFISGTAYTVSCWMKAGVLTEGGFTFPVAAFSFNLSARVSLSTGAVIATSTGVTASTQQFSNGWWRVSATATATATASAAMQIRIMNGGFAYVGTGTGTIYLWGAQLEAGALPTSYIPTTTATVTRAADVASITGASFSSWYNQTEGTVFANATTNARHAGVNSFPRIASLSDGTTSNRMDLLYRVLTSYTDAGYSIVSSNVSQAAFDTNNERNGQSMATAYAANNFAFTVGGTLANTDSSGTVPTVDRLSIGLRSGIDLQMSGTIRRLVYWPVRLGNNVLQQITQ